MRLVKTNNKYCIHEKGVDLYLIQCYNIHSQGNKETSKKENKKVLDKVKIRYYKGTKKKTKRGTNKMTREETIIQRLNTLEEQLKRYIVNDNTTMALKAQSEIKGMIIALRMMGYQLKEDYEKAENIDDIWISTYTGLIDLK